MQTIEKVSLPYWIDLNSIKTETGMPLTFKGRRYMFDIYADRSFNITAKKAAQVGFTTYEILKSAHEAKNEGGEYAFDIIYVLPTYSDVEQFSGGKTNRIIDNNRCLQDWTKDKDSIDQKRFGRSTIYYRGSWTERTAIMISAKKVIVDEFDKCKQEIVEQYDSRMQANSEARRAYFSTPTLVDFGIDRIFKQSDQKKWNITHSCGKRFVFDESCINYEKQIYECPKCHQEITDEERDKGEWYDRQDNLWTGEIKTGDTFSGWWIPLWLNLQFTAKKIGEYKRTKSAEYFANNVAGLAYTGSGNKVSAQIIKNCLSDKVNERKDRIIIGVDTGLPIHYVMANKQGFFYYGTCSDPSTGKDPYMELAELLRKFPSAVLVSDQGGDLIGIRKLQAQFPGRVFLAWYRSDLKNLELSKWGDGEEYGKVLIDRNRAIQWFIDEMTEKRVTFNGSESDWHDYITHWLNIYRTWEKDESGAIDKTKGFKWERNGPDHWCHASIYARIGLDKYAEQFAKVVGQDPFEGIPVAGGPSTPATILI